MEQPEKIAMLINKLIVTTTGLDITDHPSRRGGYGNPFWIVDIKPKATPTQNAASNSLVVRLVCGDDECRLISMTENEVIHYRVVFDRNTPDDLIVGVVKNALALQNAEQG